MQSISYISSDASGLSLNSQRATYVVYYVKNYPCWYLPLHIYSTVSLLLLLIFLFLLLLLISIVFPRKGQRGQNHA